MAHVIQSDNCQDGGKQKNKNSTNTNADIIIIIIIMWPGFTCYSAPIESVPTSGSYRGSLL